MNLRKITSLTLMFVMIIMSYTGIMLFISPPGRIANWSNWKLFGLSKENYAHIHSIFMVLFIIMTLIHVFYNWKPLTSYMKNSAKQMILFTKEMVVSIVLVLVFLIGTIFFVPPFSFFLDFGNGVKNSWEKEYGSAPYAHAELSSLKMFVKKMGYDFEKTQEILKTNNINFKTTQSLNQIGDNNSLSPQFIYNLLRKNFEKAGEETIQLTGMGRKTISEVAKTLRLSDAELISKLKALGIEAKEDEKFREVVEKYDMSPMSVIEKLGYKKPE
ncbi:DUF4405 domain-containing protein [Arcobacter sp.]|uniref:DUF4405 domain-containing protein n=1 Tax=Arcobacter sp. TaxID=1872629 RepID=UPI003C71DFF0